MGSSDCDVFCVLCLVRVKRLWIGGDDSAKEWAGTARLPRQLRGHRGRCGALRLCLAGRAEAGQPAGRDLQGGRGHSEPRADDRPPENIGHSEGRHHPPTWRLHPTEVGLRVRDHWCSMENIPQLGGSVGGACDERLVTGDAESSLHGRSDSGHSSLSACGSSSWKESPAWTIPRVYISGYVKSPSQTEKSGKYPL